jgi:hypothetical protein
MSSNLIKKITEAFYKKDDYEETNIRLPHPYYDLEEVPNVVDTQPRLKISMEGSPSPGAVAADHEATKVAQLHIAQEQLKKVRWILRVVSGVDQGRQYLAVTPEIKIGRKPENHICLKDPKVSRFHAVLHLEGSVINIIDLNSTNGTIVNGEKIMTKKRLASGDQIRVGETAIQIDAEPW